ncbi:hypothetical protein GCM10008968_42920 [Bacillus horti]
MVLVNASQCKKLGQSDLSLDESFDRPSLTSPSYTAFERIGFIYFSLFSSIYFMCLNIHDMK